MRHFDLTGTEPNSTVSAQSGSRVLVKLVIFKCAGCDMFPNLLSALPSVGKNLASAALCSIENKTNFFVGNPS